MKYEPQRIHHNQIYVSTMSNSKSTAMRPYTAYNLFFQLEREYILQNLNGYRPTIAPANEFNPDNKSNYSGPPLPSRYDDLILPYDWHIPGKTHRRKRSHRKSHGKIGFHELNEQISRAWSMVDDEIKRFCTRLSNIGSRKYKKIKKRDDKGKRKATMVAKECKIVTANSITKDGDRKNGIVGSFDWAPVDFPQDNCGVVSPHRSSPKIDRIVSRGSCHDEQQDCNLEEFTNTRDSLTEIDMDDDEIIDLWKSTSLEEDVATPSLCQVCVETLDQSPPFFQEEETQEVYDIRTAFIDEEYERFKEIGKIFKMGGGIPC